MLGLSTRKYGESVREFTEAYGLEKSAVSEHFIEASRAKLKDVLRRIQPSSAATSSPAARAICLDLRRRRTRHRLGMALWADESCARKAARRPTGA
jgi:DNA-binding transcriptional ArsR family regulator